MLAVIAPILSMLYRALGDLELVMSSISSAKAVYPTTPTYSWHLPGKIEP